MRGIRRAGVIAVVGAATAALGAAGERRVLTPEVVHGGGLAGATLDTVRWHPDGRRLTFLRTNRRELRAFDLATGREGALLSIPPGEKPESLSSYRWSPDGRRVVVTGGDDLYLVDEGRPPQRITEGPEVDELPDFSSDGKRLAWVRDHDLHVWEVDQRRARRLTRDGSADVRSGRLDWVYEEELAARAGKAYSWSTDGRTLAYLRLDSSAVPQVTLVDYLAPRLTPVTQRYPAPADPSPTAALGVVDAAGKDAHVLRPLRDAEYLPPPLTWTPDGRSVAFLALNRRQDRLELRLLDVAAARAGAPAAERTVLAESSPAWVNVLGAPLFLRDGRSFLWLSERDGGRRLYRCTVEAGECRRLGDADLHVDRIVGLDEKRGLAYFVGAPHARDRLLYSAPLDGGAARRLTADPGTHEVQLAPAGDAYVDVHSTSATPPRVHVVTLPARRSRVVEANPASPILGYEGAASRWVDVRAADGTPLHGRLLWPAGAETGPPRPAVVLAYGGPRGQYVRDMWSTGWVASLERMLVARGYVVWMLDNRGSGGRGHAFEAPLRGDLGRTELADQLAGVEFLKQQPFVDGNRLGLCGSSYGGYLALYAAVHAPDVFRAVAAGAPVTDWRRYDSIYTERYLGLPAENAAGYDRSGILGRASAIRAGLLLFHGTADDNVHLSHTVRLLSELHAAGKSPDLQLFPGEGHSYKRADSRIARDKAILAHFDRWLARGAQSNVGGPP